MLLVILFYCFPTLKASVLAISSIKNNCQMISAVLICKNCGFNAETDQYSLIKQSGDCTNYKWF